MRHEESGRVREEAALRRLQNARWSREEMLQARRRAMRWTIAALALAWAAALAVIWGSLA